MGQVASLQEQLTRASDEHRIRQVELEEKIGQGDSEREQSLQKKIAALEEQLENNQKTHESKQGELEEHLAASKDLARQKTTQIEQLQRDVEEMKRLGVQNLE